MRFNKLYPYILVAPAIILICLISLYPTLYSFFLSLNRVRRGELEFVGLQNFSIILRSSDFWESLRHTIVFGGFFIPITLMFAFLLAMAFNRKLPLNALFMTIVFVPWMLSEIVSGVMFRWLFLPEYGLVHNLLEPIFGNLNFLGDPAGAMGVVTGASIWRTMAFAMLLMLAGLQTIPADLYQAAAIDGANRRQIFWHITWQLVRPTTLVVVLLLSIQAVNATGMFLAITEGGPGRATEVLSLYMYREAIEFFNLGYGAALSVVMFLLNVLLAIIYFRVLRSESVWS